MSDLFRQVDKKSISKNSTEGRYQKFGFSRNPFPNKTSITINDIDNRNNGSIYIPELRETENKEFEKILIPNPDRAEPKTISFLMDYATRRGRGIGKTAFLWYQKNRIMADLGNELSGGSEVLFAAYINPRPDISYKKFGYVAKLIIEAIIDQDILTLALSRLRVFTGLIDARVLQEVKLYNLDDTVGNDQWLIEKHKDLGEKFDVHSMTQTVRGSLIKSNIDPNLATAVARFGNEMDHFRKWYFNEIKETFWRKDGSKLLFNDFVKILINAKFTKGLLLFDELEKIVPKLNSLERREFCESLRYYFIDGDNQNTNYNFLSCLLTIHPYLQELLIPHWEASGLQRFASLGGELVNDYTVYFEPLHAESAIPLALAFMDESREKSEFNGKLDPFDEEGLLEALKKTTGVPGRYLNFLHSAIEKAIDESWKKIGVSEISKTELPSVTKEQAEPEEGPTKLTDTKTKL